MASTRHETATDETDVSDITRLQQRFVDALPDNAATAAAIAEGQQVASIVAALGLPKDLLAAVCLYPLIRDEIVDINVIENNELSTLSQMIIDLVQLDRFTLPAEWRPGDALATKQSEALRKMLLAVVSDVRLVLVRIAEQLYRLRQARNARVEEQRAIAIETREIFAALANRLGVWQLKWELEDLSFRYLEPDTYRKIAAALNEKRTEREQFIESVKATLQDELHKQGIDAEISGRPKHIYSIWRKMQRKDRGLESLFDIRAVRVLVDDVKDC
ncbi:MAG: HD domain-containing protein, partial [Gammaproteobacteria bacterium]|nr:HD domain-containing protein [Gammaproteobacteria bacterium]